MYLQKILTFLKWLPKTSLSLIRNFVIQFSHILTVQIRFDKKYINTRPLYDIFFNDTYFENSRNKFCICFRKQRRIGRWGKKKNAIGISPKNDHSRCLNFGKRLSDILFIKNTRYASENWFYYYYFFL